MFSQEKKKDLLLDMEIQVEATEAVNAMYNFEFEKAEKEFRWMKYRHPNHPLPYFLIGFAEWWKIVPNEDNDQYDKKLILYFIYFI